MVNKTATANLCNAIEDLSPDDMDEETDDKAITSSFFGMVSSVPEKDANKNEFTKDNTDIQAHLEYGTAPTQCDKTFALSDGGADSCILGRNAKVLEYTGRYVNLVGYHPDTTKTSKIPIVTALIKAQCTSLGNSPVLLKVHEAAFYKDSSVTLLSEYQIQEHGLIIDSVVKKYFSTFGRKGAQRLELTPEFHIDLEDRGGLMGFELLPIEDGDEDKDKIIIITSPEKWIPHQFDDLSHVLEVQNTMEMEKGEEHNSSLLPYESNMSEDVPEDSNWMYLKKNESIKAEIPKEMSGPGPLSQKTIKLDNKQSCATKHLTELELVT